MNTKKILISVILPVYNCEKYIFCSINSILKQTYKNIELLIIDDGSTDNTSFIVESFYDNRIRFFKKEHCGLIETLKFGIKNAKGNYIARMDADDISHPERLKLQLSFLIKNNADICGSSFSTIDEKSNLKRIFWVPESKEEIMFRLTSSVPFCHGSILAKKEIFLVHAYGSSGDNLIEDYSLWIKMFNSGVHFKNNKEILYYLREHSESLSNKNKIKFRLVTLKAGLDFSYHNKDKLRNTLESKTISDFLFIKFNKSCKEYINIIQILNKNYSLYKPPFYYSVLLILFFKEFIYKLTSFLYLLFFKIYKCNVKNLINL